jgi:Spy/CpxP family protein refolding chaperone
MHAAFKAWHMARRALHDCGFHEMWKGRHGHHGRHHWGHGDEEDDSPLGAGFGVRRPLRYLAHHLELDDKQVAEFARILDDLKTERAQAEVDHRRTVAAFADALSAETFDAARAAEAGDLRVKSAERLRDAVAKALQRIHAVLNADQRTRLAYLIRAGTLSI